MVIPRTYGRMGNFLFQAATAMAYAWKHGVEYSLPNTTQDPVNNPIYLQHLVNPRFNKHLRTVVVKEQRHGYQELKFDPSWRAGNIQLDGYWQSEKYFLNYREQILKAFAFPWRQVKGWVSFHVRRGDYLTLTRKHPPVSLEWMEKAMKLFPGYRFRFFSDDLVWCKSAFDRRPECDFSKCTGEVQDLIQMSWCEHHICSASTFSWWGAWLNQNPSKRVVMPAWWFTPGYQGLDTKDIVPANWERLA
jgi:hypothetical protein